MTINTPLYILSYGSLIFKPPLHAYHKPIPGLIRGYIRRFWQSSSDHRGTPEFRGRVATLVSYEDVITQKAMMQDVMKYESKGKNGMNREDLIVPCCVYYIKPEYAAEVREYLDVREQDGYTLHSVPFLIPGDVEIDSELTELIELPVLNGFRELHCQVYIGTIDNESFVGPEDVEDTAEVVGVSVGPSGENLEYLQKLVVALKAMDEDDEYLNSLLEKSLAVWKQKKTV